MSEHSTRKLEEALFFLLLFSRQGFSVILAVLELTVQLGLELREPFASASQVLGLKACATTAQLEVLYQ